MTTNIGSGDIAGHVNGIMVGPDVLINAVAPISELGPHKLAFIRKFSEEAVAMINSVQQGVVICSEDFKGKLSGTYILSDNPRLAFLRAMQKYFVRERAVGVSKTAVIHPSARIGAGAFIGENTYIGTDVVIGDNCNVHHGVVVTNGTRIGNNCTIKSNSVIGESGFGFEYSEFGKPEHFPHIGRVVIGHNVWIGSCSTIERAALDETRIDDDVKIDDKVQVGHNCRVGRNTLLMAGVVLCGGCTIGSNCWIAPNTTVKEKVNVRNNVYTGLASVVINDIDDNTVVVGNPAKILRRR